MSPFALVAAILALGCVVGAAVADVRRFEIPDGFSIAIVALFAPFALLHLPVGDWLGHIAIGLAVFGAGVALFARGWMGGGDVKLLGACALWAGTGDIAMFLAWTMLSGGLLAAAALAIRRIAPGGLGYPAFQAGGPLPYAVAILGGVGGALVGKL